MHFASNDSVPNKLKKGRVAVIACACSVTTNRTYAAHYKSVCEVTVNESCGDELIRLSGLWCSRYMRYVNMKCT